MNDSIKEMMKNINVGVDYITIKETDLSVSYCFSGSY